MSDVQILRARLGLRAQPIHKEQTSAEVHTHTLVMII